MKMFRQGDVLLMEVKSIPKKAKDVTPKDRIVLAYGEVTGHAHAFYPEVVERHKGLVEKVLGKEAANEPVLKAKLWDSGAERFLQVMEKTALRHEEHSAIEIPQGNYKVVRQREYDPQRDRIVAD